MNKLWMLARSNIRSTKSASATLVIMFIIAALLLNAGLLVVINYGSFFDTLKEELSPTDVYFALPDKIYTEEVKTYIKENEHVKETQSHDLLGLDAKISSKGKDQTFPIMFNNIDEKREISRWKYVGKHLPAEDMSVYIPDVFKAVSGYELNDKMQVKYTDGKTGEEKSFNFTVKGYTEDIFFSSYDTGYLGFYLPSDTYRQVEEILNRPEDRLHIVFANLDDVKNSSKIESGIREVLKLDSASLMAGDPSTMLLSIDVELIELSRCIMARMVAAMMVIFSMFIVIVCLMAVRFRIVNSIQEDIMKLGSLKSIGYTSRQIVLSVILQFSLIAGIGSIAGIALTYPLLPSVAAVFEQQSGLKWEQGFDAAISSAAFLILILIVVLAAFISARRVGKLNPIDALRGQTTSHKYKRNRLPLDKTSGGLTALLAFKSIFQNLKQNIMITSILIIVTFAGSYGLIMYYNTSIDTKAFAEVPGFEICNVIAVLNTQEDQTDTVKTIENMDTVRKVQYLDEVKLKVDGSEVAAYVMDDYSTKETQLVYEGHYPKQENEITLAGVLAERLEKTVGDTVSVVLGSHEESFKVVGLSNGSAMGGFNTSILTEDYIKFSPQYKHQSLYIYFDEGTDAEVFIKQLKSRFDNKTLLGVSDFDNEMEEGMESYQHVVAMMGIVMLIITILVVVLVLYFVISSSIIRKRRELGIQKAIGFTTLQLMNQLSISFSAPIVFGAVIGSLLGAFCTNPLMSATMKGMGVMKASFIVDAAWVTMFGVGVIVLSYLLSMLVTWRIRKISAYALVTE